MIFRSKSSSKNSRAQSGCGFTVLVTATVIALMLINAVLANAFFETFMGRVDARIVDPIKFISAVLMVFLEYWLFDQLAKLLPQKRP